MVTVTHDLSLSTKKVLTFTASTAISTANKDIVFTNYPAAGKGFDWYVIINQDSTGGVGINWPSEVVNPPDIVTTADTTSVIQFQTIDGGAKVFAYPLHNASAISAGIALPFPVKVKEVVP